VSNPRVKREKYLSSFRVRSRIQNPDRHAYFVIEDCRTSARYPTMTIDKKQLETRLFINNEFVNSGK